MNTEDLPQDQEYENQVRNENINLDLHDNDFNKNSAKDQPIYGQEYLGNSISSKATAAPNNNQGSQSQQQQPQVQPANSLDIRAAGHPKICVLHFIFKVASILTYFLISSTVVSFALTIVFASFDFWVVKNVTGRKLVLLKWDNEFNENGDEKWIYVSTEPGISPNQIDSTFFWFIQLSSCGFWLVFSFLKLVTFGFFWMVLTISCFLMAGVNVQGYYKCRGAHQKKVKEYMTRVGIKALANNF